MNAAGNEQHTSKYYTGDSGARGDHIHALHASTTLEGVGGEDHCLTHRLVLNITQDKAQGHRRRNKLVLT